MLDSSNGPFSELFPGSDPSSHTEIKGDPQIGPAIPWDGDNNRPAFYMNICAGHGRGGNKGHSSLDPFEI